MQCTWIIPKPSPSPPGCGKLSSTKSVPREKKAAGHWVIQARIASTHLKLPGHIELQAVRVRRGFGADRPLSPPGGIPSMAVPCWEPRELAAHFSAALPTERCAFRRRQQGSSHACLCSILLWMVLLPLYHTCSDTWGYKGWVLSWLGNLQLLQSFRKEQIYPSDSFTRRACLLSRLPGTWPAGTHTPICSDQNLPLTKFTVSVWRLSVDASSVYLEATAPKARWDPVQVGLSQPVPVWHAC